MKKYLLSALLLILPLAIAGCGSSVQGSIKDNMSEITNNYYYAECDDYSLSISVGKRENQYVVDGIHHEVVDFSLLVFKDKSGLVKANGLDCKIKINGEEEALTLIYNPVASSYMFDLGFALKIKDEILFSYNNVEVKPNLVSQDFKISASDAIKIASEKIEKSDKVSFKQGECYLKVVGEGSGAPTFWYFSLVTTDSKSFNLIISAIDGSVLASDL